MALFSQFLCILLLLASASGTTVNNIERPAPKYRCNSILGICGKTLTEEQCTTLCLSWYSGTNPDPYCATPYDEVYCYCRHDCLKA
ncbi:hypothetical protein ABFS83_05G103700 [Erythranthe nasuta]